MWWLFCVQDDQLAGVVGASGGVNIIPAVVQVFLNHFILRMEPLKAVQHPRVFHTVILSAPYNISAGQQSLAL